MFSSFARYDPHKSSENCKKNEHESNQWNGTDFKVKGI